MSRYASNTTVAVDKSRAEIERTLRRYGADKFAYGWDREKGQICFVHKERTIKIVLVLPAMSDFEKTRTGRKTRNQDAVLKAWEQACRQKWRALALVIKAKLEAVESGIATFEDEFLAYTVLPDGSTAGEFMQPQIETALTCGTMPKLLIGQVGT